MVPKTASKPDKTEEPQNTVSQCVHHWIIDPPDGPTSNGVCQRCGETKEFENWGTSPSSDSD